MSVVFDNDNNDTMDMHSKLKVFQISSWCDPQNRDKEKKTFMVLSFYLQRTLDGLDHVQDLDHMWWDSVESEWGKRSFLFVFCSNGRNRDRRPGLWSPLEGSYCDQICAQWVLQSKVYQAYWPKSETQSLKTKDGSPKTAAQRLKPEARSPKFESWSPNPKYQIPY